MQYQTNNLDEAAYCAMQGYRFTVTRTGPVSACFAFLVDDNFENIRSEFWKGLATVRLDHWLAMRTALKHEVRAQVVAPSVVAPPIAPVLPDVPIKSGSQYWYRDGSTVKAAFFGNRTIHTDRIAAGNFYRSRGEASLGMKQPKSADIIKMHPK